MRMLQNPTLPLCVHFLFHVHNCVYYPVAPAIPLPSNRAAEARLIVTFNARTVQNL